MYYSGTIKEWNKIQIYDDGNANQVLRNATIHCSDGVLNGKTCSVHTYKNVVTKATLTENGKIENKCSVCGNVSKATVINSVKTVKLSTYSFTYNGQAQKPSVIVKDSAGKTLKLNTDYTVSYSNSSSKNIGKYTVTITLKGNYSGTKTLGYHINAVTPKTIKLSSCSFTYNGKAQKPNVIVKDSAGKPLKLNTDYTVTYSDSSSKNVGKYTVTVKLKGNYSGSKTIGYCINPKGTDFLAGNKGGIKAAKNGFTLKWNKQSSFVTGYKIEYSTRSDFKNASYVNVFGSNNVSKTITGRASGTRYYVRIRTFYKIDGKTFYSPWSSAKSVTTLK